MADAPLYSATATFLNMDDTICMAIVCGLQVIASALFVPTCSGQTLQTYYLILLQCTLPENRKIPQSVKWKELSI